MKIKHILIVSLLFLSFVFIDTKIYSQNQLGDTKNAMEYNIRLFHRFGAAPFTRVVWTNDLDIGINGLELSMKKNSYEVGLNFQYGAKFASVLTLPSNDPRRFLTNDDTRAAYLGLLFNYHLMPFITKKQMNRIDVYVSSRIGNWIPNSEENYFPANRPHWTGSLGLGSIIYMTKRFGVFGECSYSFNLSNNLNNNALFYHVGLIYSIR